MYIPAGATADSGMVTGNNKADPTTSGEMNVGSIWLSKLECTGHTPLLMGSQTGRNGLSFIVYNFHLKNSTSGTILPLAPSLGTSSVESLLQQGLRQAQRTRLASTQFLSTSSPSRLQKLPSREGVWAVELHHQH